MYSGGSRERKIDTIPKNAIAYYLPHPNGEKRVFFTKDTLLILTDIITSPTIFLTFTLSLVSRSS